MNKIDVLSKINEGMRAVLAKEDELAGNANDTSAGFEQMRLNYTAGRAYWVEGGPEMAEKVDCKVEGPHGDIPVRLYYPVKDRASLASDGETLPVQKGDSVFVPAGNGTVTVSGNCTVILTTV